jgi:cytochrome P450
MKVPYVEAFLLETWRHACLDPFLLLHAASRDATLYGYDVPKGTLVYVNMYAVNRDPLVWDRPTDFDPTRFLDADGAVDRNKAEEVMAFGAGKRRCIGELLGRQESFIMLAMLCRKFEFLPLAGVTYDVTAAFGLTLIPHQYKYVVKERRK